MKFSIITCTYNSEKFIRENINSVKNQTFEDFEHIFIDAFSKDGTMEILQKYQEKFPNKVSIFQSSPKGIANAMNKGIEKANGEYIIHLHADDSIYDAAVLNDVSNFIDKNKNPDWIYGKANFININTHKSLIIPHRNIYHKISFWLLLLTNYIPHQSVFIKKETFNNHGNFNENYKNSMDYDLWLRFAKNKVSSKFFNRTICNFFIHPDSQSSKGGNNSATEGINIHKKYISSKLLRTILAIIRKINSKRKFL